MLQMPPSDRLATAVARFPRARPNRIALLIASLTATQPLAIVSRSYIEDTLLATADFNQIALITPSVSNYGGVNGTGLSESKAQIRSFQDGEYNVTYDGVPFSDHEARWQGHRSVPAGCPRECRRTRGGVCGDDSRRSAWGANSLPTIAAELNARGIVTPRGGKWHPSSVRNLLARLERAA